MGKDNLEELEVSRDIIHTEVRTLEKVKTKIQNDIEAFEFRDARLAKLEERQDRDDLDTHTMLQDVKRDRMFVDALMDEFDARVKKTNRFLIGLYVIAGLEIVYLIFEGILGW